MFVDDRYGCSIVGFRVWALGLWVRGSEFTGLGVWVVGFRICGALVVQVEGFETWGCVFVTPQILGAVLRVRSSINLKQFGSSSSGLQALSPEP